jgi:hypothetical protein
MTKNVNLPNDAPPEEIDVTIDTNSSRQLLAACLRLKAL